MADLTTARAENIVHAAGWAHLTATRAIEASLRDVDDATLAAVLNKAHGVTETNCWFAEYHAAPLVIEVAKTERERRRRATSDEGAHHG